MRLLPARARRLLLRRPLPRGDADTRKNKEGVQFSACAGGGTRHRAARGNRPEHRVDRADQDGWRGVALKGAPANPIP